MCHLNSWSGVTVNLLGIACEVNKEMLLTSLCLVVLVFSADPPLLLVSLDGFRNSYFQRNVTPTLKMLCEFPLGRDVWPFPCLIIILLYQFNFVPLDDNGVRAKFMRSSFPTVTFPNHHSIATVSEWSVHLSLCVVTQIHSERQHVNEPSMIWQLFFKTL